MVFCDHIINMRRSRSEELHRSDGIYDTTFIRLDPENKIKTLHFRNHLLALLPFGRSYLSGGFGRERNVTIRAIPPSSLYLIGRCRSILSRLVSGCSDGSVLG